MNRFTGGAWAAVSLLFFYTPTSSGYVPACYLLIRFYDSLVEL
jgi:hypothetical protein